MAVDPGVRVKRVRASVGMTTAVASVVVLGLAAACSSAGSDGADRDGKTRVDGDGSAQLLLRFDELEGPLGTAQSSFANEGSALLHVSVARGNHGQITSRESWAGNGHAVTFPEFGGTASAPRAVIGVTSANSSDVLSPGSVDFEWGADFTMHSGVTSSKSSTSRDNGDNLLQRGLYSGTQYKLQIDGHRPSCRLRGSTGDMGAVYVAAPVTVAPGAWYRAVCTRSGERLTITVEQYDDDGTTIDAWHASRTSDVGIGDVTFASAAIPLSVGGKLDRLGALVTSAGDQFNGSVDNVFYKLTTN